jgi:hypothetical protein
MSEPQHSFSISSNDTSFNIVNFIETNPNSQLTNTYNNRLLEKIKTNFTELEQQLYISSFYCYLNYHSKNDFVIDLDNIWQWLGFSTKQKIRILLEKKFTTEKDYKILLNHQVNQKKEQRGGHNKETILLNIHTFKLLCIKAATSKANEIHEYFVKLEELLHEVIKEESEELKKQLENSNKKTTELEDQNNVLRKTNEYDKHSMLIQEHDKKRLVYIMKLETLHNGKFIIKIGETTDIKQRSQAISSFFGIKTMVMDLFPCDFCYEFEQFLHKQPSIYKYKYNELINKTKKSSEAYIMTNMKTYTQMKQFILRNIHNYNAKDAEKIKYHAINNALEIYKDDKPKLEEILDKIISATNIQYGESKAKPKLKNEISYEENNNMEYEEIIDDTIDNENMVSSTEENAISKPNTYSPKVQIYDSKDLSKVVNIFDSITEATRQIKDTSYTHIKYASRHRTIYKGYRWYLINNNDTLPFSPKEIGKTVDSNEKKTGLVVMMSLDKTRAIKVFILQKDAAQYCNTHTSLISNAIRYGSSAAGYFWVCWDDLDIGLQEDFLKDNELPIVLRKSKGSRVQKINPQTGMVECEYPSITDATKEMKMSVKTIKRSSSEDIAIGGWKWKIL